MLDIIEHHAGEKTFSNYLKYEINATKYGWVIFLGLILEDFTSRTYLTGQTEKPFYIVLRLFLFVLFFALGLFKLKIIKKENFSFNTLFNAVKVSEIVLLVTLISTLCHSVFFYFVALLPITFISLTRGFKKALPYIFFSWGFQLVSQVIASFVLSDDLIQTTFPDLLFYPVFCTFLYLLFSVFCYVWGTVHREYTRSEEENNILIDRLGDKYVQLEQAKREIQAHLDRMRETNSQLEQTNNKLTASLAEFYTLQQISQAITSIYDMNELLKFVNDVIIGVMGVHHSTIALCHGPLNRLKVQVSSIFDKKDLAVVSDYINCDILKASIDAGHSMLDNEVDPEDYPFTRGRSIQSLICAPLLAKGHTLGVVLIEHSIKNAFNNENVRLLEVISQQVGIAIENTRLYRQMHELATLDGLTGAYNRLYFQDKLEEEMKKAQDGGYDLSFIMLDIDHFKKFNDAYGHLFGDLVLKTLSSYIMKSLRKEDIFARYGGEEFVVVLPHTPLDQALEKAEELRAGIAALTITDRVVSASITISVGVSSFPKTAGKSHELIDSADDAMYEAKNSGRNRAWAARERSAI